MPAAFIEASAIGARNSVSDIFPPDRKLFISNNKTSRSSFVHSWNPICRCLNGRKCVYENGCCAIKKKWTTTRERGHVKRTTLTILTVAVVVIIIVLCSRTRNTQLRPICIHNVTFVLHRLYQFPCTNSHTHRSTQTHNKCEERVV